MACLNGTVWKSVRTTFLVLCLLTCRPCAAGYMFRHLGVKEGLSQSTVLDILQDKTGFIWIATKSGLNRFDGMAFVTYNSHEGEYSLGSDYITALYEDPDGKIWVGTDNGIWIYDPLTDLFHHFTTKSDNGLTIANMVNAITGCNGKVYIAANEEGIFCYDLASRDLTNHEFPEHPNVSGLNVDDDGTIWIGFFGGGLWKTDNDFKSMMPYTTTNGEEPFRTDIVTSILRLDANQYVVGSDHCGLSIINTKSRSIKFILSSYNGKDIFIRDILCKGDEIWAASEMGLFIYSLTTNDIGHYSHNPSDPLSLSDTPLYSLLEDEWGGIWIGSYFGGINYLSSIHPIFERFMPREDLKNGLHGYRIREMAMDKNGKIWIGTEDGGLNCMDPASDKISFVRESFSFPNIHGLYIDDNLLWVGTFSYGLKVIDIDTQHVIKAFSSDGNPGSLRDNTIFSIAKSPDGVLFFGTIRGLCRLDSATQEFKYIEEIPAVLINHVFFDSKGNLWLATQTKGAFLLKNGTQKWKNFRHDDNTGLFSDKVLSVFEDSKGVIWVATQNGGAYRFNIQSEEMELFHLEKFNPGNTIFKIEEDRNGILWFTSYYGIIRYNPNTNDVRSYSNASILLDNQFNYSSSLLDKEGRIYFGSLSGFVRFNPEKLQNETYSFRLVATELLIGDEKTNNFTRSTSSKENIVFTKEISLPHKLNSFKIRVIPINYVNQQWNSMEYKLEGMDNGWLPMPSDFTIAYNNLPTGSYTLRVHAKDNNWQQEAQEYTLKVEIRPYVLWSAQAKIIYAFSLCLTVFMVWRHLVSRSKTRRIKLMKELETKKEKEIYQSKLRFVTEIAHEIRTPLTLIKIPLGNIINSGKVTSSDVREDLDIMYQNTERLNNLINQLLDFKKAEKGGLRLNFDSYDIKEIVTGVLVRFHSVLRERKIKVTTSFQDNIFANVDKEAITKIVSNLINNAVKYCTSEIHIILCLEDDVLTLIVKNDGEIIPHDFREKIFQPFFRVNTSNNLFVAGAGIGLALAHSLTELHGGTLAMDDDAQWNVFRLTLPAKQGQTARQGKNSEKDKIEDAPTTSKPYTILLVEDNIQMLEYEKRILKGRYNVLCATDGENALNVLSKNDVALIVSDIMMEPMDGLSLCKNVKRSINYSHIPFILLTAVTSEKAKIDSLENGADAYIIKPFSTNIFFTTIDNLLKAREKMKKAYANTPFISAKSVSISSADAEFLKRLNDAVSRNIGNSDFNVIQLASEMNMSRTSLNRKIRGVLDVSPASYIHIERLKMSARLLKDSNMRINEICYRVGFTSPSYFAKCFYKQFGILPKDFKG